MLAKIIHLLGGFTGEDILAKAMQGLFNTITEDDILKEVKTEWRVGDKMVGEGEKKLLISEAQVFLNSKLWKVLKTDIRYRANLMMFEKSKTEMDLVAGKLFLYALDCIKTRLESLTAGRGTFNDNN